MSWSNAMLGAFLATIGRGRWWLAALAAFLVRGGVVALLPAIVVLPTPAELARHLDPSLEGAAPGDVTPALVGLILRLLAAGAVALVVSTAVGTWLERGIVAEVAADEELEGLAAAVPIPVVRAVAARLLVHVPTLAAVVVGGLALAGAAYAELLAPSSTAPLAERVVEGAPAAVAVILATWLLAEAWGGAVVRRLGRGDALANALAGGLASIVRPSGLATLALGTVTVGVPLLVLVLAAGRAFDRLRPLVTEQADPGLLAIGLGLFVGTWGAGLWLLGIALAFRSAAWTAEVLRQP